MASTARRKRDSEPLPAGFWASIALIVGVVVAVFLHWPFMPFIWLALLLGGLTARRPIKVRVSDEVDPRKEATYRRWKNRLAGLSPIGKGGLSDSYKAWYRVSFWNGMLLGLLASTGMGWVATVVNMLFGFMACLAYCHARDLERDYRHAYTGVSVKSFLQKAGKPVKITVLSVGLAALVAGLCVSYVGLAPWQPMVALPLLLSTMLVWLLDRKRQTGGWRELVEWQARVDGWISMEGSPMQKTWDGIYLTQVNRLGDKDNPIIVIRCRSKSGIADIMKKGMSIVMPMAIEDGYSFGVMLSAKRKKQGQDMVDPNCVRLVLGKDETCLPDMDDVNMDEKLASLVATIAYAKTAELWNKVPPLVDAHQVSGDGEHPAWLLTFTQPPSGGEDMAHINLNWLANDPNPSTWMSSLPIFADICEAFQIVAREDTPLSDKGNKWRTPDMITVGESFQSYVDVSRRFQSDQATWGAIASAGLRLPSPNYDGERVEEGDGWGVALLPLQLSAPATAADYARLDLKQLDPTARFVGIAENGADAVLVTLTGNQAPTRIDRLVGCRQQHRLLAQAMLYESLIRTLPRTFTVSVKSCTQEGVSRASKGVDPVAIWRADIEVGGGANVGTLRSKTASIQAELGAACMYWDWRSASEATLWMMERPYTDVDDMRVWRRPVMQKQFIQLVLSDAWGVAGVSDKAGRTPVVKALGVLPRNKEVLKARFELPGGMDMERVDRDVDKFLTAADYAYGRILPRGDDMGALMYEMILAKHSPFPTIVNADWDYSKECSDTMCPLGVNDMGDPVSWELKGTPHIAILGKTGTGKSSAMQVIVAWALLHDYQLVIVDPVKGAIDFAKWAAPKSLAFAGEGQMRECEASILWVEHEMQRRANLMKQYGVGNINDMPDDARPPRLLIAFDEANNYISKKSVTTPNPTHDLTIDNMNAQVLTMNASINRTMSALGRIALAGRTAGISIVMGAQRLSGADVEQFAGGKTMWRNMGRVLLGSDATIGVISAGNLSVANHLQASLKGEGGKIPQGRGIYESAQAEMSAVQTWWSGGQDKLCELVADVPDATKVDLEPFMPKEADQFGAVDKDEAEEVLQESQPTLTSQEIEDAEELDW